MFEEPNWEGDHLEANKKPKKLKKPQNNGSSFPTAAKMKKNKNNTTRNESKPENKDKKRKNTESETSLEMADSDTFDEIILNAKRKKFNEIIKKDDVEETLFNEKVHIKKVNRRKEQLKHMLNTYSSRTPVNGASASAKLRQRMLDRLKAAQFRYLNEKLYTTSGSEAKELFESDPAAFTVYHQGYQQQLTKWPVKPLELIVKKILKMPKTHKIVDMGCGEALLAKRVPQTVRSFDLVSVNPRVEVCDMAHTPLLKESMDVVVYCLALMGTELTQYLVEANRILKNGGNLLIAEVESRFDKVEDFTSEVQKLGFKLKNLDKSHQVFYFMEFVKIRDPPVKKAKLPYLALKPCLYKKR